MVMDPAKYEAVMEESAEHARTFKKNKTLQKTLLPRLIGLNFYVAIRYVMAERLTFHLAKRDGQKLPTHGPEFSSKRVCFETVEDKVVQAYIG